MKKLTLLVAGLAMGLASAFAADIAWNEDGAERYGVAIGGTGYDYAGYAVVDGITNGNKLTITYTGDIYQLRLQGAEGAEGIVWFNPDQSMHFTTVDGSEIVREGNNTTISVNLVTCGFAGVTAFHVHAGDAAATGTVTISSMTIEYDSSLDGGEVAAAWESKDGSVKLHGTFKVGGYVFQREDFGQIEVDGETYYDADNYAKPSFWYDTYANEWVKTGYPAVNQNFTFALEAKDDEAKAFFDYQTEDPENVKPTVAIHTWVAGGTADEQSGDCRLERVAADKYVYAADMNFSELKGSQGGLFSTHFENKPVTNNNGETISTNEFWFNTTIAFIGDETAVGETAAWWACTGVQYELWMAPALATPQTIAYDADWATNLGGETALKGGIAHFGSTTGIEDVIADSIESGKAIKAIIDGNVVIVKGDEVYSILGAKIK